mmetsp:Transcript_58944/g.137265  ORF Transcript_58944/g.137265 Transcript_58944/m.137265 type:complete len:146 (-) Transcript_58944:198-635(-)|eukprot:CAMPEP_0171106026 /NCGR_PEP_ID=MMETSP0766_2-20121228/63897_1 /TAXON_ID=439317 /ORGANISM="Gambierdiscus australes, Strain CAWD 149" /LENGTH=145 /DNA_ID=CAMNT_0011567015 /DNA_START=55 /DNA_END=492 /DNA_ORIENTATION=-
MTAAAAASFSTQQQPDMTRPRRPRHGSESAKLDNLIRKAQIEAGMKRMEAPSNPVSVTPDSLFGNWTDSYGNTVCVYSTDAFDAQLIATLSKPPRHDINLKLQSVEWGCGWHCGGAALVGSTVAQLWWLFPDGSVSIWTRKAGGQ